MSDIYLLILFCGFATGIVRQYFFMNNKMNWTDAQQFCRHQYRDLASITTEEENKSVTDAARQKPDTWIGMYRSYPNSDTWLLSDGESNTFYWWEKDQPNNFNQSQDCVMMRKNGWNDYFCSEFAPFLCEKILVLVKENKTWEEAYEHCRSHYTGLAYLASDNMYLAEKETGETQTTSVWTGLRFLAGEWFWVNREPLGSMVSLPSCPAQPYRCGALNTLTKVWENRDCEKKLNFLCY